MKSDSRHPAHIKRNKQTRIQRNMLAMIRNVYTRENLIMVSTRAK